MKKVDNFVRGVNAGLAIVRDFIQMNGYRWDEDFEDENGKIIKKVTFEELKKVCRPIHRKECDNNWITRLYEKT